ncbi:MAG: hypothetical protein ACLRRT_06280 [Ruthenibacterium lactatiformans]
MRKTAIFILAITLCALLSGCGKAMTISLPFAASDVENVEMYHYVVPASAEKKIITQADAISELYAVFSELPVSDRKTEPVAGGAVTSSGSTFRIIQAMKLFIAQRLLRGD